MDQEKLALLSLSLVSGVGDKAFKLLISYCGTAEDVFKKNKAHLTKIPGIGIETAAKILSAEVRATAEKIIKDCEKQNIQILSYLDSDYPSKLKQIYDAPPIIYCKGNVIKKKSRNVAVVGTRNASEYGKEMTRHIVQDLASYNVNIISGLAYGIDISAHQEAVKNQIPTWGVLACGLDMVYPALHKTTAVEMLQNGGLISEQPPGTKPDAFHFPARNRIIAGCSDITVVVEAAEKGGALITANLANEYDREVGAVPGKTTDTYSKGCLQLIQQNKAHLITCAEDIAGILNWDLTNESPTKNGNIAQLLTTLTEEERALVEILIDHAEGIAIDNLSWKSQIPVHKAASNLLNLEFKGLVKALPGKKYKLSL